jgi:glycosyltransferase involved in cell wall biosynthesis
VPALVRGRGPVGRIRALGAAAWRTIAIGLVVRSQRKASRGVVPPADLYHGMAYMGIPVALSLAGPARARAVYDARDIYVDAGNLARLPRPARAIVGRLERGWARRADRVITVNRPYAEVMSERWGVPLPLIVLNCSYRYDPPSPPPRRFHEALGLDVGTRVVLYHGGFSRDRGIEQLIEAISSVERAVLVLLGYGALQGELERRAADPSSGGRVRLLPAVPPGELLEWVASADIVAMPIQPTTLNHRLTTPNKLFEAMAAGVPVVASDLPGMSAIVTETGAGLLVDPTDPADIANTIKAILDGPADELARYGQRALAAAHATYNWERQMELLLAEYGRLTGRPW